MRTVTVDLATSGAPSPAIGAAARGGAPSSRRRAGGVHRRPRLGGGRRWPSPSSASSRTRRDLGGLISAGGSGGTALATQAMRAAADRHPQGDGVDRRLGRREALCRAVRHLHDVFGDRRRRASTAISEQVLSNAAHALAGMIAHAARAAASSPTKPAIGLTMFGVTTPCVQAVTKQLEDRYDCLVFHATGTGGQSMEKLVDSGLLAGVIDATTTEIADEIGGGVLSAGPRPARCDHPRAASPMSAPAARSTWSTSGPWTRCRRSYRGRNLHVHNPNVTLMRTTAEESAAHRRVHRRQAQSHAGAGALPDPARAASRCIDAPGKPFWDPAADKALFDVLIGRLPRRHRPQAGASCRTTSTTRPSPTRWSPHFHEIAGTRLARARRHGSAMARIARKDILDRLRGMIARGEPIIGGGAGTGLSAKCEEAGGIDLIVIYNSGRYRMAGRGSLAGLLAYGNANEIVRRDGARGAAGGQAARRCWPASTAPIRSCSLDDFLRQLGELGFSGVQNFPTVGLIDGVFRAESRGDRHGLRPRGRHDPRRPRARPPDHALRVQRERGHRHGRGRRRHHRLPHGPDDRRQHRRRDRR